VAPHNGMGGDSAKLPPWGHRGPPGAEALGQQNGMGIARNVQKRMERAGRAQGMVEIQFNGS